MRAACLPLGAAAGCCCLGLGELLALRCSLRRLSRARFSCLLEGGPAAASALLPAAAPAALLLTTDAPALLLAATPVAVEAPVAATLPSSTPTCCCCPPLSWLLLLMMAAPWLCCCCCWCGGFWADLVPACNRRPQGRQQLPRVCLPHHGCKGTECHTLFGCRNPPACYVLHSKLATQGAVVTVMRIPTSAA